jgi:soluble lytic murein transglycosylase-like protein
MFKKFVLVIPILLTILYFEGFFFDEIQKISTSFFNNKVKDSRPKSIIMFDNLENYSKKYGIPKHIVYNIAYLETKYKGPYDWNYKHNLTSSVGALGPMKIMPATANFIRKYDVPEKKLLNDIEFNVETSLLLLKNLHDRYKNWELVCGYYNTGRPIINDYASFCVKNVNYKKNWKKVD